jgi:DNA-binding MurR/RpiR family transcriptional regulator
MAISGERLRGRRRATRTDGAALGYSRPDSYEELRAVLSSGTVRLPKRLRQVAIFLWQHPAAVALGTATSVAAEAEVQPSALVRFAQSLGYSGFSELQDLFKSHLAEAKLAGAPARRRDSREGETARLVEGFLQASAASLARVNERLDVVRLEDMAQALAGAEIVYLVGSKRAFAVVNYVSLSLANLGVRNIALDNVGAAAFEMLRGATPRDALLAVSFTPYNSITPELAAAAAQMGVPILALTDSAFSPLAPISRAYVEVVEESFSGFKSLSATLAVAMALALRIAELRGEGRQAEEKLNSRRGAKARS